MAVVALAAGCADPAGERAAAAAAFDEANSMVEAAATEAGVVAEFRVVLVGSRDSSGSGASGRYGGGAGKRPGANGPNGLGFSIRVSTPLDNPTDPALLDRIRKRWVEEFGYEEDTDRSGDSPHFSKGDNSAGVSNGSAWVVTEMFDPSAAKAATAGRAIGSP